MNYKDIINYQLAEWVTNEQLLTAAEAVMEGWMRKQPGFMGWEIHEISNGNYADIVYWADEASAKKAEEAMSEGHESFGAWQACYEPGSISSNGCHVLKRFQNMGDKKC